MHKLDDVEYIKKLDKSDMYSKIMSLPQQIQQAYFKAVVHQTPNTEFHDPNSVIICGMGGSAISADIAKVLYDKLIPISVVKDYDLPYLDEHTLVIVISYSGNTSESLSCMKQAMAKTKQIVAITSGGKIKDMVDGKYPWLEVPAGYPPRSAIGFLFFSLIKVLEINQIIPTESENVKRVINAINKEKSTVEREINICGHNLKNLADGLLTKIPIIYSDNPKYAPIAYRWKCQINENAKYPAFHHTLPEMLHNEIEGWEHLRYSKEFIPVFIYRFEEQSKGLTSFLDICYEQKIPFYEALFSDKNDLVNMMLLIFEGDIVSYYLAIMNDVDPTEIGYINYIKEK